MQSSHRALIATLFSLVLFACGCTAGGRLDPIVPGGVAVVAKACGLVPDTARVGAVPGQTICSAVASALADILNLFTGPGIDLSKEPMEGVVYRGITIGTWPAPVAQRVRDRIAEPERAAKLDKALGLAP